jgi:hypothetical protein
MTNPRSMTVTLTIAPGPEADDIRIDYAFGDTDPIVDLLDRPSPSRSPGSGRLTVNTKSSKSLTSQ